MRLPAPQGDLRPDAASGHARHPVLHRLPEARRAALPGRRRRRRGAGEGRGAAGLRRRRRRWSRRTRSSRSASSREEGSIRWERREYGGPADLEGVFMVIAATSDTDVNIRVFEDAERRAMLVNVVDVPPLCNFILPGDHPHRAARDRDLHRRRLAGAGEAHQREIAEEYGEPYARLAVLLNEVRGWAKARCRPTRTARTSSSRSSTASPTRSSCCAGRRAGGARPDRGRAAPAPPACLTSSRTSTRPGAPGWSTWAARR